MERDRPIYESEKNNNDRDPDEVPVKDRRVSTQPYDLAIKALIAQIADGTIFLKPISERPSFQRRYVWTDKLASKLIESILLNVPIPPCYLSQNEDFELDVIDGQQRLFSIYRFINNQFNLTNLEVLPDFNGLAFFKLPPKEQKKIETHTLRCVLITNESHPEIKFDVFERLNTNTIPLNAQELRNCLFRGGLNNLLKELVRYDPWLSVIGRKLPDKRMRDEELILRFFAFYKKGLSSYRTPQKHWLNDMAKEGRDFSKKEIEDLGAVWKAGIDNNLILFPPSECFRRIPKGRSRVINRALMDLNMITLCKVAKTKLLEIKKEYKARYKRLFKNEEFIDLISKSIDHTKRTKRRFEIWKDEVTRGLV
jgi:hypothetical protein